MTAVGRQEKSILHLNAQVGRTVPFDEPRAHQMTRRLAAIMKTSTSLGVSMNLKWILKPRPNARSWHADEDAKSGQVVEGINPVHEKAVVAG
jgi:hypothetical protein